MPLVQGSVAAGSKFQPFSNWRSPDKCNRKLTKFEQLVNEVKKYSENKKVVVKRKKKVGKKKLMSYGKWESMGQL